MARRYSRSASKDVKSAMRKRKRGTLRRGERGRGARSRAASRPSPSGSPRHARRERRSPNGNQDASTAELWPPPPRRAGEGQRRFYHLPSDDLPCGTLDLGERLRGFQMLAQRREGILGKLGNLRVGALRLLFELPDVLLVIVDHHLRKLAIEGAAR